MQMAPPPLPKKLTVRLPENEEIAGKLLEKYRSMMAEQPGGLSEPTRLALSAAYRGLCASKEPIRSPRDLLRIKGVGPWIIRVMKDSFPATSPDLSPRGGNTAEKRGEKKICASEELPCVCYSNHTLRGNDKRKRLYDKAGAYRCC